MKNSNLPKAAIDQYYDAVKHLVETACKVKIATCDDDCNDIVDHCSKAFSAIIGRCENRVRSKIYTHSKPEIYI